MNINSNTSPKHYHLKTALIFMVGFILNLLHIGLKYIINIYVCRPNLLFSKLILYSALHDLSDDLAMHEINKQSLLLTVYRH